MSSEPRGNILPVYFVADESMSMRDVIGELNSGLASLLDALNMESMVAAKVRFSVLGFSDDTICHLPPADLRQVERVPTLTTRATTSYASAFLELRRRIPADVQKLRADGYLVHRPAVFFLSDGYPNEGEDWRTPLAELKSAEFRERPNILAFGIGDADPAIILEVASSREIAFQAAHGTDTGTAIAKFCEALTQSIISSGQAMASGDAVLQGQRPEGFTLAVDVLA
jgi:uncharacterized protein YegL